MGLSMIINRATGMGNGRISYEDTGSGGKETAKQLQAMIRRWLREAAPAMV